MRLRRAGWKIVHVPTLTILHHGSDGRALDPRLAGQSALGAAPVRAQAPAAALAGRLPGRAAPALRRPLASSGAAPAPRRARRDGAPARPPAASVRRRGVRGLLRRLRGVRVQPARPAPDPVAEDDWRRLGRDLRPARPGRDRRHRRLRHARRRPDRPAGRHVPRRSTSTARRTRSTSRPSPTAGSTGSSAASGRPSSSPSCARSSRASTRTRPGGRGAGRSRARSTSCPCSTTELPGLRFLHVVRDGRDMAFSDNQVQLRKHGDAVLGPARGEPERRALDRALARDQPPRRRARRASSATATCASGSRISRPSPSRRRGGSSPSSGSTGDAERIAAEEVGAPDTLGRWRGTATVAALEALRGRRARALRLPVLVASRRAARRRASARARARARAGSGARASGRRSRRSRRGRRASTAPPAGCSASSTARPPPAPAPSTRARAARTAPRSRRAGRGRDPRAGRPSSPGGAAGTRRRPRRGSARAAPPARRRPPGRSATCSRISGSKRSSSGGRAVLEEAAEVVRPARAACTLPTNAGRMADREHDVHRRTARRATPPTGARSDP